MNREHGRIATDVLNCLLPMTEVQKIKIGNYHCNTELTFKNGSYIKVVLAHDGSRGNRFNGVIVDTEVPKIVYETIVLPCLVPLRKNGGVEYDDRDIPVARCFFANISCDDVDEAEGRKGYIQECISGLDLLPFQKEIMKQLCNTEELFKKEYKCMWDKNDYDTPVVTKELNNTKIMLYKAWGIPKENINYEREFVNKTKQTFLNVRGDAEDIDLGFENQVNIHILIDTNVYDGYEVNVADGMVKVILHEIENTAPKLKDFGKVD